MDSSRKRSSSVSDDGGDDVQDRQAKRQRTADAESRNSHDSRSATPDQVALSADKLLPRERLNFEVVKRPSADDFGRCGLRRSIGVALKQVGFDGAKPDALESFTELVDTYVTSFVVQIKRTANAARRNEATPLDFEQILHRHDIPLSSLKPHLKNPYPKERLSPTYYNPVKEDIERLLKPKPYLGEELSGKKERDERPWIPKTLPSFPSPYTYKFTPYQPVVDYSKERAQAEADAKKAELALRRISRAARISRQKELKAIAEQNALSKRRQQAWEEVMTDLLPKTGSSNGAIEIADHSTVVDFEAKYGRREVPKASRRAPVDASNGSK
ncbi:hypothetical protein F5Y05DRAFT_392211 [Hypoxylon sp. FL0543]|nr:hypothetical protein F5Y05DRAFT_392211 [Hypoxylon sp. FL0543]